MKEGCTYKKLGEFIEEYSERDKGKGYPVYSVTNSKGFCQEFFGKNVASEDTTNYKIVPRGCFAYNPSRINVGSVAWQNEEDTVSVSPLYVVFSVSPELSQDYLLYYIKSNYAMTYINALARGAVRNNLKLSTLKSFDIPYASISEQQKIVHELDLLNDIINKQKAQIDNLDNLAQSIFYDMFGDPITNERRWKVKNLGEICDKITDGSHNPPKGVSHSNFLMLSSKNVTNQGVTFDNPRFLTKEQFETENKRTSVRKGDIFLVIVGAGIGKCCIYKEDFPITLQRSVAVIKPKKEVINSSFLNHFLVLSHIVICNEAKGAAQKGIYLNQLFNVRTIIPPLTLQQEFAAKIEEIDAMKAKVRQSLKESEQLFNSRMDYYFN